MAYQTIKIDFQNQDSGKQTQNHENRPEVATQFQKGRHGLPSVVDSPY